jgi:hypothetical protein
MFWVPPLPEWFRYPHFPSTVNYLPFPLILPKILGFQFECNVLMTSSILRWRCTIMTTGIDWDLVVPLSLPWHQQKE